MDKGKLLHGVPYEKSVEIRPHEPLFCKGAFKNFLNLLYWIAVFQLTGWLIIAITTPQ